MCLCSYIKQSSNFKKPTIRIQTCEPFHLVDKKNAHDGDMLHNPLVSTDNDNDQV